MSKKAEKPGPKPDSVSIDGDWDDAINKALLKQRPQKGWPNPEEMIKQSESDDSMDENEE